MRKRYDFSLARRNPYAKRLKRPVTIRLDEATIAYFRQLAADTELPYQSLINLYLRDCAAHGRRLPFPGGRPKPGLSNRRWHVPGASPEAPYHR